MNEKPDQETLKALAHQEKMQALTESDQWQTIKAMFIKRLSVLDCITDLPDQMPIADKMIEFAGRQHAIQALIAVIKDVEGDAFRLSDFKQQVAGAKEDDYIERY